MDRLRAIGTFVQIAKSGSLTKAAEELGMSRALASAHLKELERHLGVRLVNRTTRRVSLTSAGADYLAFCVRILENFEAEEARISQMQDEPQGQLKLMASMAFGHTQLAPIATEFTAAHPSVKIALFLSDRSFSPSDFVEGGYDLAVSMHVIKDASLVIGKVADGAWLPCATLAYLARHEPVRQPSDLARHNCLVHRSHAPDSVWRFAEPQKVHSTQTHLSQAHLTKSHAVPVAGSLFTNSSMVLREAVLADAGIAMLPAYAIGADLDSGRMARLLPSYLSEPRPIYIVYPHAGYLPKRTRLFIDFLRSRLKGRLL
jgi:DNA-binding transcriptional LysR family regulator